MKGADMVAEILKREGIDFIFCFPQNPLIEAAAAADIRPVVCRNERVGINMADGYSRLSNGRRIGVFVMQYGPGAENAYGGVAQSFTNSGPILVLSGGFIRHLSGRERNFGAARTYAHITKWSAEVTFADQIPEFMRRAFYELRTGRPGPVLLEFPTDVLGEDVSDAALDYEPVKGNKSMGDPDDVRDAAAVLLRAQAPILHAGQGVLWAEATNELVELAELLQAPVMTTLLGKSGFPEDHPLALGDGPHGTPVVAHFLTKADVVFGIGCSFTRNNFAVPIPPGKVIIHATNDAKDVNRDYRADYAIIGDARFVLRQLIDELKRQSGGAGRRADDAVIQEVKVVKDEWLKAWLPKLTSDEVPLNPYRIIWDLRHTVDRRNTIATHDSGSPREQMSPFYQTIAPRTYIGWGRSTQLGYGLGGIMGAKLAAPEKLCVNVMGDAAIGMVGMDFETAVRANIPILTIVLNNGAMAGERQFLPVASEKYKMLEQGGNYSEIARALGGWSERISRPDEIVPAIKRAIQVTEAGSPALLEFLTKEEHASPARGLAAPPY